LVKNIMTSPPDHFTSRFFTIVKNRYERTQSVIQLIQGLGWETLETRRLHARLLEKFRSNLFLSSTAEIILTQHYISRSNKWSKIWEIHWPCPSQRIPGGWPSLPMQWLCATPPYLVWCSSMLIVVVCGDLQSTSILRHHKRFVTYDCFFMRTLNWRISILSYWCDSIIDIDRDFFLPGRISLYMMCCVRSCFVLMFPNKSIALHCKLNLTIRTSPLTLWAVYQLLFTKILLPLSHNVLATCETWVWGREGARALSGPGKIKQSINQSIVTREVIWWGTFKF
jgi:hypothetical protein